MQLTYLGFLVMMMIGTISCRSPVESTHDTLRLENSTKQAAVNEKIDKAPLATQPSKELTHTVTNQTPYYAQGPQQGAPPDGHFNVGTKLLIHAKTIGEYVLVEDAQGKKGYIDKNHVKKFR